MVHTRGARDNGGTERRYGSPPQQRQRPSGSHAGCSAALNRCDDWGRKGAATPRPMVSSAATTTYSTTSINSNTACRHRQQTIAKMGAFARAFSVATGVFEAK
eukprot:2427183-Rhodomonas_salina.3